MKRSTSTNTLEVQELLMAYEERKSAIQTRLVEFANVPPSQYFYELVYCLLTPQSSAINASKAVTILQAKDFQLRRINPEPILRTKDNYIRFHKTKSRHLLEFKKQYSEILNILTNSLTAEQKRVWLVHHVLGFGLKEATHFLRNIGLNNNLAILDRHILRRLQSLQIINEVPLSLSPKMYLAIEQQFLRFSDRIGIPINELDLLFWSMATGEIRK